MRNMPSRRDSKQFIVRKDYFDMTHGQALEKIDKVRELRSEIDCRVQHGAESIGHLEYVLKKLNEILEIK